MADKFFFLLSEVTRFEKIKRSTLLCCQTLFWGFSVNAFCATCRTIGKISYLNCVEHDKFKWKAGENHPRRFTFIPFFSLVFPAYDWWFVCRFILFISLLLLLMVFWLSSLDLTPLLVSLGNALRLFLPRRSCKKCFVIYKIYFNARFYLVFITETIQ